jgi:hypothetical protein
VSENEWERVTDSGVDASLFHHFIEMILKVLQTRESGHAASSVAIIQVSGQIYEFGYLVKTKGV